MFIYARNGNADAADLAVTGEENDKHKPRTEMECNRRGWDSA